MIPREVNQKQAFGSASVHTKTSLTEATFFILCVICLSRHGSKLLQTTLSQESYKTESRGSSVALSTNPGLPLSPDFLALTIIYCLNIFGSSFLLFAVKVFSLLWRLSLKGYVIVLHAARKILATFFCFTRRGKWSQ